MTRGKALAAICNGILKLNEDELEEVASAYQMRHRALSRKRRLSAIEQVTQGTRIQAVHIKPKYLEGFYETEDVSPSGVLIQVPDAPRYRNRAGRRIRIPFECVRVITQ